MRYTETISCIFMEVCFQQLLFSFFDCWLKNKITTQGIFNIQVMLHDVTKS